DINKFYDVDELAYNEKSTENMESNSKDDNFRWSIDISNMHEKNNNEYFILVAISRINLDEDMKETKGKKNSYTKGYLNKNRFKYSPFSDDRLGKDRDLALNKPIEPENEKSNCPNDNTDNTPKPRNEMKKGVAIY